MTSLQHSDLSKGLFDSPVDFRSEVIYFLIVDRFHDATSDEEERQGVWIEALRKVYTTRLGRNGGSTGAAIFSVL